MVSPAYDVFEINNTDILNPEFLMMWFSRKEFDRNAWFYTDADVRGGLPWKSFCDMQIPVPLISKQREIVAEYNTIQNRIKLNEQLIQKLEETAQAIYKQWFVKFEFPDENGQPYKSNGGEMVWNEELEKEIPMGWEITNIGLVSDVIDCLHSKKPVQALQDTGNILLQIQNIGDYGLLDTANKYFISNADYKLWTSRIEISEGDCILTNVGVDAIAQIPKGIKAALGRNMTGIRLKKEFNYPAFIITLLLSNSMKNEIENNKDTGTIMQALNVSSIPKLRFVKGAPIVLEKFESIVKCTRMQMEILFKESQKLTELKELLLSKLATV
jgi:type I restriction enzyme S subunit